jgi:UDP-N-acetylmuramoyl-L-alanyl-D-glutamate--2,6-diaminopimelate ligase
MKLHDVVAALREADLVVSAPDADPALRAIADDSRSAGPGTLFCAIPGTVADGHAFLPDAIARGAVAALVTTPLEAAIPEVVVRDARRGTNGKSTTVALIRHLLNAHHDVAQLGTLGAYDGAGARIPETVALTTPGPVALHATLAEFVRRGVTTLVMEASSHALDQQRLAELTIEAAVYTNLTHEHLDYHKDYEHYFQAKARLSDLLAPDGVEVVNADDPAWDALPSRAGIRRVRFGLLAQEVDVAAEDVRYAAEGTAFVLRCGRERQEVQLPLIGDFNVSNALGAAATVWALGGSLATIAARLATAPQVPGRMERIVAGEYLVLRDYAHTPDAFERVLRALRPATPGRLVILFGCGGDRDRKKRPVMGRIAAEKADVVILSDDNPRTEDPARILDEIETGMAGIAHFRIPDRDEAIRRALTMLKPGDTLLMTGKGPDTYQIVGTTKYPFDERVIVLDALGIPA